MYSGKKEGRVRTVRIAFFGCFLTAATYGAWAQQYPPPTPTPAPPAPAPAAPAAAAPAAPAAPLITADAKLVAFELGINGGLKLGSSSGTIGRTFGMDLTLGDTLSCGLVDVVAGTAEYTMVKVGYRMLPAIGFSVFVGSDATPTTAAGVGVSYSLLRSRPDSGLASGLRLDVDYFASTSGGFGKGDIVLGVVSYLGL